jgi:hypothetical protein
MTRVGQADQACVSRSFSPSSGVSRPPELAHAATQQPLVDPSGQCCTSLWSARVCLGVRAWRRSVAWHDLASARAPSRESPPCELRVRPARRHQPHWDQDTASGRPIGTYEGEDSLRCARCEACGGSVVVAAQACTTSQPLEPTSGFHEERPSEMRTDDPGRLCCSCYA